MIFFLTRIISALFGWLTAVTLPHFIALPLLRLISQQLKINLAEANQPLENYRSFSQLFRRDLKAGIRPIGEGLVSPVDGTLRNYDSIRGGQVEQVKGMDYALDEFISDKDLASSFNEGSYFNLYLSPKDYHHIHAPVSGKITRVTHIPGSLLPVNDWSVNNIGQLFCRNERVVVEINSEHCRVLVVMVGATNVGSIALPFMDLKTNDLKTSCTGYARTRSLPLATPLQVSKGERIGSFLLGSTVVLILNRAPSTLSISPSQLPMSIQYGQSLGLLD